MLFYSFLLLAFSIFLICFACIIVVVPAVNYSKRRKNQTELNTQIIKKLNEDKDIKITRVIKLNDNASVNHEDIAKQMIFIDGDKKKIVLVDYNKGSYYKLDFNEILNYEVYENGNTLASGGHVGGVGLGFFGTSTEQNCKDLSLIIRLKKYNISHIKYDLIYQQSFNFGVGKSTDCYKKCIATLQEAASFLEIVKSENENTKEK